MNKKEIKVTKKNYKQLFSVRWDNQNPKN